jgi:HD-GYP domain-containing protein (c-di-GMP phosphodiesterase class II)
MLTESPVINEQVRQIIYQHHEHVTGTGYPNGLTGLKIYPLAKIVCFAEAFAETMAETKLSPRDTIKLLLQQRHVILQYDATVVRALVKGFS